MSKIITEDNYSGGYAVWCQVNTPYPIKGMEGRNLLGIFQLKSERDRFAKGCQLREPEVVAACQLLEETPIGIGRMRPSGKRDRILREIQKSCGIIDT